MPAVPALTPVTTPVVEFTVATPVALLLQLPPPMVLPIVMVLPAITVVTLAKLGENARTVIDLVRKHEEPKV
jgi:hypothetical protein